MSHVNHSHEFSLMADSNKFRVEDLSQTGQRPFFFCYSVLFKYTIKMLYDIFCGGVGGHKAKNVIQLS